MAVLGIREPCVKAVVGSLTLFLPPKTTSLSPGEGGAWPEVAWAGSSEAVVAPSPETPKHWLFTSLDQK